MSIWSIGGEVVVLWGGEVLGGWVFCFRECRWYVWNLFLGCWGRFMLMLSFVFL